MTPTRYAIYYVPDLSQAWAQACTAWLGWDVSTSSRVAHPELPGMLDRVSALTAVPRRYGLHATIKPPFRLSAGKSPMALMRAAGDLAARLAPARADGLVLTRLGRFLALTAAGDNTALNTLASQTVRDLDGFRAQPTAQELERRRAGKLTPSQEQNLARWGYPHVMENFRFHITLTGKLPKDDLAITQAVLSAHLGPLLPAPLILNTLALVGEDEDGFFHLLERFPLSGT
ncbi:MAG: DUF1045 domain-containing protein [Aestuariivita sp.]|uniref:DUF1045 domain-containing protein n=1 Tax=Aestuariivita sp. TaxID=1872407 RepID=UPI003BB1D798